MGYPSEQQTRLPLFAVNLHDRRTNFDQQIAIPYVASLVRL